MSTVFCRILLEKWLEVVLSQLANFHWSQQVQLCPLQAVPAVLDPNSKPRLNFMSFREELYKSAVERVLRIIVGIISN